MKMGAPHLTTDLSGSVGGVTASKARGGVRYFRARVRPSNPRSGDQSRARLSLSSAAASWRNTLTDVQRQAWSDIAPSGQSGIDVYAKCMTQIDLTGQIRP